MFCVVDVIEKSLTGPCLCISHLNQKEAIRGTYDIDAKLGPYSVTA